MKKKEAQRRTQSIQDSKRQNVKTKKIRDTKNLTHPHLEPNQSKKLIKSKGPSSIYNLVQDQKLHKKEFFILWIESSSSSKAILFLFFHTAQKRQKGASIQAFLRFLPMKDPCQPSRVSLTENGRTQVTPKRANNSISLMHSKGATR